jgi:hypothetical protein
MKNLQNLKKLKELLTSLQKFKEFTFRLTFLLPLNIMKLLKFQKKILKEWLHTDSKNDNRNGDGLVIVGKGMGVVLLTLGIMQVSASEKSLVLLLNASVSELEEMKLQLNVEKREFVNCVNEMNAGQRVITYSKG